MSLLPPADCWPRRFTPASLALQFCEDPTRAEQPLFAKAGAGEAVAQLWQAPQGFVVPGLSSVCGPAGGQRAFCRAGLAGMAPPLRGGLVPGGRDYQPQPRGRCSSRSARPPNPSITRCALCCSAPRALRRCQPRPGGERFLCDGRYNLACGEGEEARKIVGTAQYWRPQTASGGHVVLAHAVILIDADLSAAHQAANAFEAQLGSGRVYRADKTVTTAQLLPGERHLLPASARRWPGAGRGSLKVAFR